MIVCCTNNTRDAQFGLFVCACLFLVSASSDLGPMFKVSFSAFLRCECSSSRPLDTFSFILNAASSGKERCWKSEKTAQFAFRLFTLRYRGYCANVLAVRSNCCLLVPELVMLFVRLSIYPNVCLSVRLSVCVASQL